MRIGHNHIDATITMVLNPEEARQLSRALLQPSEGDLYMRWHQQIVATLTKMREEMGGAEERCPGSGTEGRRNGALLSCKACGRLIGTWPPDAVPEHDRPVFDDGEPKDVL